MDKGNFGAVCSLVPVWYSGSFCAICSALATGVHHGVVACNGCKAFYHRSITKKSAYRCKHSQQCAVGPQAKGRCRFCRLVKCTNAGMRLDSTPMGRIPQWKRNLQHVDNSFDLDTRKMFRKVYAVPQVEERMDSLSVSPADAKTTAPCAETDLHARHCGAPLLCGLIEETTALRSLSPLLNTELRSANSLSLTSLRDLSLPDQTSSKVTIDSVAGLRLESVISRAPRVWETIGAVQSAHNMVYDDDSNVWRSMSIVNDEIPCEPQQSMDTMAQFIRCMSLDVVKKNCQFFMKLPGFTTFSEKNQQQLLTYWPASFLTERFRCIGTNGIHFRTLDGSASVLYTMYWMRQFIDPVTLDLTMMTSRAFRDLQLSDLEAHLVHAVSVFTPDDPAVEDRARLDFMHAHYTDCLRWVIRSNHRGGISEEDVQIREDKIFDLVAACRSYKALILSLWILASSGPA